MKNYDLSEISVLVVENNRYFVRILTALLEALGVRQLHSATSGDEALKILRKTEVDLILTEWQLYPMHGRELIATLRTGSEGHDPTTPIIVVTGQTDAKSVESMRDAGANEVIAKPVSAKAIYERVVANIERPREFVRAGDYVGPDRRRKVDVHRSDVGRRQNDEDAPPTGRAAGHE